MMMGDRTIEEPERRLQEHPALSVGEKSKGMEALQPSELSLLDEQEAVSPMSAFGVDLTGRNNT